MYNNVLVTGSSGFIGGNLAERLKKLGLNVLTLDLLDDANYTFDISVYSNFKQITDDIDIIFHLAAQSGGYRSLVEHELDLDWNAKGTLNICMYAKEKKIKKIIYASSMAVYGEGDWLKETDNLNPLSNYGISKLYGETCLKQFAQFGIDYTIFRIFNTYGPGQNLTNGRQGVVAVFVAQILKGNVVNVTGSLDRYRDLTFVDDTVNAITLGMDGKTSNEVYNVCSKIQITIGDLINKIIDTSDKNLESLSIKNIGKHDGDQYGNTGDNAKLKSLGWRPKVTLDKGINIFYDYAKSILL